MNFDTFPKSKKPEETSKKEVDAFEAWAGVIGVALVVSHFWKEKSGEIRSAVEEVKKVGTGNPLLFGDRILSAISKFNGIIDDYQVETEEERARLQNNTIDNLTLGKEKLEVLKQKRARREADLLNILRGGKRDPKDAEEHFSQESTQSSDSSKETETKKGGPKNPEGEPIRDSSEAMKVKIFSMEFIKERVRTFLASNKNIKEVKNLEVKGSVNEITLNLKVLAGPLGSEVGVQAVLESKGGNIKVKSHKIEAGWMIKGTVEGILVPKLNEVSELLKSYIEKEEKKKVEKMEIINGELVIKFK